MHVAITGGTGYAGTALRKQLAANGHTAFDVRRGPPGDSAAQWDPAANWVRPGTFDGVDAVVHLSGVSIGAKRWTESRRALLRSSRVDSARVLVNHLLALPQRPSVLITASAVGYYGEAGDRELDESSPKGEGFLPDLVQDWEAESQRAAAGGVRVLKTRFAPMMGNGSEILGRLRLPFSLGLGGRIGSGQQWFSWVATADMARALQFLLEHESIDGVVNVVSPNPVRSREFTSALGRALHRPTPFWIPAAPLKLVYGSALVDETLLLSQRVVPARLLEAGFEFQYPAIDQALVESFRKGGKPAQSRAAS